jgi:hypothetical protein
MSDVAWARVERGLMQRLDDEPAVPAALPPRRRWWLIAAPALAVAATIALVIGLRGGSDPLAPNEPSRVVAGEAPSSVSFGDAHLALAARSAIVMTQEGGAPSVLVERGAVMFTVAPRAERPAFVVRAGDVVVRVVGTKFQVARYEERIAVAVEHGMVDVIFRGTTVRVGAAQQWSSEAPEVTTTIALASPASPPSPSSPSSTSSTSPSPSSPSPSVSVPAIDAPTPTAKIETRVTDATSPSTSVATPGTKVVDGEQAKFERMQRIEPKDSAAAIAGYLEISRGNSKWAGNALFSAGRLAADRKDPRARTFLEIYLRRFPDGANAADAKNLLDRLQGARR